MSRTIQWCDGPTPSASRPPLPACTDNAWRASAIGCCACSGTTAVPSSIRLVRLLISDTMVSTSKSSGTCGIHAVSRPAASAHSISARNLVTLRAISPRSAPIITPSRIIPPPSRFVVYCHTGQRAYVADQCFQRRARREYRGGARVEHLLHVGLRDGATDDDRDIAGIGGPQRVDGAGGQREVRTGQDRKPHHRNIFLQRDRHDVLDALPDAGVDHLESRVAQGAGDDLGAAVMPVETGLGHQNAGGLGSGNGMQVLI